MSRASPAGARAEPPVARRERRATGWISGAGDLRVPVVEHARRVVLPQPGVQLVERREPVAVAGLHELELLPEQLGRGVCWASHASWNTTYSAATSRSWPFFSGS